MVTYMLPVAELLSVGSEPLERSIWANLRRKTPVSGGDLNDHIKKRQTRPSSRQKCRATASTARAFLPKIYPFSHTVGDVWGVWGCVQTEQPCQRGQWHLRMYFYMPNVAERRIKNTIHTLNFRMKFNVHREILKKLFCPGVKPHHCVHFSMQIYKLRSNLQCRRLYFRGNSNSTRLLSVSLLIKQCERKRWAKVNGVWPMKGYRPDRAAAAEEPLWSKPFKEGRRVPFRQK